MGLGCAFSCGVPIHQQCEQVSGGETTVDQRGRALLQVLAVERVFTACVHPSAVVTRFVFVLHRSVCLLTDVLSKAGSRHGHICNPEHESVVLRHLPTAPPAATPEEE